MRRGAVQVAGIHDVEEAELLLACGVDLLGFPLRLDHHAEDCSEAEAARIVAAVGERAACVLITYETGLDALVGLVRELGVGWVQLHAPVAPRRVAELREQLPDVSLIKSLVVRGGDAAALDAVMDAHAPHVQAFLTDTFDPVSGASGATGRTHDWRVSRRLAERSPRPLVLAGGLDPENVYDAVRAVRPYAVDVHTGVEGRDGRKDPERLRRFVEAAGRGFRSLSAE